MAYIIDLFADWAWANNSNPEIISPEICLSTLPIPSVPCITTVATKLIGLLIIAGAFLNKAPLILNILSMKSVAGISPGSVYSEIIMYANSASYSLLRKNPFTAWGENGILTLQSIIVCVMVWFFKEDPKIGLLHRLSATATFMVYLFVVYVVLQPEQYYLLMTVNLPVLIYSRGSQILTFYSCKHTGSMSLITTTMNLVGSLIRTLTTIQEVGWDWNLLSGYMVSCLLNITLVLQFQIYKKGTQEYVASLKTKKE